MKKIGTLALTLALAGSLTVPALAAEETAVPISADTGYGTALVLNGETLDLTGIPGVEGGTLLPLRLLAEADHGSAYWDEENNESWFYFGDNRIVVSFSDNSVTVNDAPVEVDGVAVVGGLHGEPEPRAGREPHRHHHPQHRPHGEGRLPDHGGQRHGLRHAHRGQRGRAGLPAARGLL